MDMISLIGLISAVILLIYLTMRGINIIIAAIICSVFVAITGGLSLEEALMDNYMTGFTNYFASWFLVFLLGAIFGKIMQETKSAESIAQWIKRTIGEKQAVLAIVAAAAIMTYGGISMFVVGFAIYPIAVSLFRAANLPHRFIPSALVFGSISFTMTSPGSPEIQNIIPTKFFNTTPTAGGWIGVVIGLLIMITGSFWLHLLVKRAVQQGESFSPPYVLPNRAETETSAGLAEDPKPLGKVKADELPHIIISIIPLFLVIAILNILSQFMNTITALLIAMLVGIFVACITMQRFLRSFWDSLAIGTQNALVAIANTCGVVGFGSVAAQVSTFDQLVNGLVDLPGPPLLGLALGVTIICALTGSASGGLGIALPVLAPIYLNQGLDPGAMHRVAALGSGGLDSMPHNGYVVTTVRTICRETHKRAYKPILYLSVILPTIAMLLAVILYTIF
nr:SLC13 family permease [Virgibacillus proomii]